MSAYSRELPTTVGEALKVAVEILSRRMDLLQTGEVSMEAEVILAFSLSEEWSRMPTRSELLMSVGKTINTRSAERTVRIAQSRADGKILQHLLGFQTFLEHNYIVSPDVLVPRPETEILVDRLVLELKVMKEAPTQGLEIGLGSGAISVELCSRFPYIKMAATERSSAAVFIAEENSERILGSAWRDRLQILTVSEGEVFPPTIQGTLFDFLVSNPPYLKGPEEATEEVVRYEPAVALFAPKDDALFFYRKIAEGASALLKPQGIIAVEIPHERSQAILSLFQAAGWNSRIELDLTGRERVLIAKRA
ncbi:MAG: peptide chain release factor N(5)-glutamine methyltransferase [Bdellovibrionales bacterium]|nr:peptide chain release factor N(5)-glutamine methyltransferase [Bdellovibrionales bacterium]